MACFEADLSTASLDIVRAFAYTNHRFVCVRPEAIFYTRLDWSTVISGDDSAYIKIPVAPASKNTFAEGLEESKKMAVPKSKITKSKRNMRRAHDALSSDAYVEDKVTGELHRPHHIDLKTGMYRGKQVLKVKERI